MSGKAIHKFLTMAGLGILLLAGRPQAAKASTVAELMQEWMRLAGELSQVNGDLAELRSTLADARQDYIDAMGAYAATGHMQYRGESRVAVGIIREVSADIAEKTELRAYILAEMDRVRREINDANNPPAP